MFGEWPGDRFLPVCHWSRAFGTGPHPLLGVRCSRLARSNRMWLGDGHHQDVQGLMTAGAGCARRWPWLWGQHWACSGSAGGLRGASGSGAVAMGLEAVWGGFPGAGPLPLRFGGGDQAKQRREKRSQLRRSPEVLGGLNPRGTVDFSHALWRGVHLPGEGPQALSSGPAPGHQLRGWGTCSLCLHTRVSVPDPSVLVAAWGGALPDRCSPVENCSWTGRRGQGLDKPKRKQLSGGGGAWMTHFGRIFPLPAAEVGGVTWARSGRGPLRAGAWAYTWL